VEGFAGLSQSCHFAVILFAQVNQKQGWVMAANILLVEDEPGIQELLKLNLGQAGHQVTAANDAEDALQYLRNTLPDVILLDWMLPGMSGIDLCKRLRSDNRYQPVPIIMLTARGEEQDKVAGLDTGADDYITKPFSPRELVSRIRAVLRRRAPQMTEEEVEMAGLKLDPVSHRVSGNGQPIDLGPTEFRLLHFFMTHAERVYSRSQLLDQVWGDDVFVEERTVDVHIRRLRLALEVSGHEGLVQTVRGSGYRFSVQK
jgi:two-component system phosphate regulon response regulator PhoB